MKFGTYEVFRIILPGFYCLTLIFVSIWVLTPTRQIFTELSQHPTFLFIAVLGSVFLGLVLYAYDHPKRIKAYRTLEMPSIHLKKKLCDNCPSSCENRIADEGEAIDTYFYVLFTIFSPSTQKRVLYVGSVYHVFADMRMLSFIFGVTIFPISFFAVIFGTSPFTDMVFGFLASSILILFWLFLHPEYFYKSMKSKGDKYEAYIMKMQRRYIDMEIDTIRKKLCRRPKSENNIKNKVGKKPK